MLCRVRVPRILIVLKGSQHGTHERYCLIDQGMGSRRARVRWSLRSDTHWPRVARPPPQSRDSASSTAASPRSAKKARHRPASSAASSAAHRKHLRPASERRASSRAPSSSLHSSSVCQTPIGSPANQAGSGDPRRPLQGCCCSARHGARELSASSYRCSAAAVHTGTTSGPPRMWRRGARSRAVPSPGRQSHDDAVQEHEDEHRGAE